MARKAVNITETVNTQATEKPVEKQELNYMDVINQLQKQIDELKNSKQSTSSTEVDLNRWVTVIHLMDNVDGLTTHFEISNRKIDFRKFGDLLRLRLPEFEELYYKHKDLFEQNIIGITSADEDLVKIYNLPAGDRLPINSQVLNDFPYMSEKQIEELYNKLSSIHKILLIRRWYGRYYEADASGFHPLERVYMDKKKVNLLNELSNGEMEKILEDMKFNERKNKGG